MNYLKNHIKGALFLDLENVRDMRNELPFMIPDEKFFIDTMKRLDIKLSDTVICYDAGGMQLFGYRAAWMFNAMGHQNVRVLDGGFQKWVAEAKPVEAFNEAPNEADYQFSLDGSKVKTLEDIKQLEMNMANTTILDGRAPEQFEAGHIPGSVNFPLPKVLKMDTKTLKPAEERKAAFMGHGVDLKKNIVLSCQGGIASAVLYESLKDICEGQVSVYDGSWAEYSKNK
mmetsp:Transcript_18700/g.28649  ORF Transcript_18700/g.28649 Transcript_18700/m.28649 type:complete len:228 (-) Transcript_18700:8-691(-)